MSLDSFVDQYIKLVRHEVAECKEVLCSKSFESLADVARVQGRLQGLSQALNLLSSIPEED